MAQSRLHTLLIISPRKTSDEYLIPSHKHRRLPQQGLGGVTRISFGLFGSLSESVNRATFHPQLNRPLGFNINIRYPTISACSTLSRSHDRYIACHVQWLKVGGWQTSEKKNISSDFRESSFDLGWFTYMFERSWDAVGWLVGYCLTAESQSTCSKKLRWTAPKLPVFANSMIDVLHWIEKISIIIS